MSVPIGLKNVKDSQIYSDRMMKKLSDKLRLLSIYSDYAKHILTSLYVGRKK